jgi:hypothetical protein
MKRSVVLAAMMMLTAACAGTPSGASTASLSPSSPVPSATSATAAPSSAPSSQSITSAPATSPTASATRTTTGPATGRVVYLAEGIYFQSAAAINSIPWFTSDEKTFLVGELAHYQSGNTCVAIYVSAYRVADLIDGQIFFGGRSGTCGPGRGGVAILWGKVSGTWKVLFVGQNTPTCADIRAAGWKSTLPKDFYGQQCLEKGSNFSVDYKP